MLPLLLCSAALAQDPAVQEPATAWRPSAEVRASLTYWRLGTMLTARGGVTHPLWDKPDSTLFNKTFITTWAEVNASPAYVRVGPRVSFEPIAVFNLQAFAWYTSYFGNFQTIISFDEPDAYYGTNEELEAFEDRQAPGNATVLGVAPTIKAKAGPVVIALAAEYTRWRCRAFLPGDYWFEREYELLIGWDDSIFTTNALLMYEIDRGPDDGWYARVGSITSYRRALGETEDQLLRSGLVLSLSTYNDRLTHTLLVQPYIKNRVFTDLMPPFTAYMLKWTL